MEVGFLAFFCQIGWHWTKIEQPGGYEGWWTCCSTRNSDWSGIMSSGIISMTLECSCWGEDVCVSITLCNNIFIYVYTVYVMQKHTIYSIYVYSLLNKYQSVWFWLPGPSLYTIPKEPQKYSSREMVCSFPRGNVGVNSIKLFQVHKDFPVTCSIQISYIL